MFNGSAIMWLFYYSPSTGLTKEGKHHPQMKFTLILLSVKWLSIEQDDA